MTTAKPCPSPNTPDRWLWIIETIAREEDIALAAAATWLTDAIEAGADGSYNLVGPNGAGHDGTW